MVRGYLRSHTDEGVVDLDLTSGYRQYAWECNLGRREVFGSLDKERTFLNLSCSQAQDRGRSPVLIYFFVIGIVEGQFDCIGHRQVQSGSVGIDKSYLCTSLEGLFILNAIISSYCSRKRREQLQQDNNRTAILQIVVYQVTCVCCQMVTRLTVSFHGDVLSGQFVILRNTTLGKCKGSGLAYKSIAHVKGTEGSHVHTSLDQLDFVKLGRGCGGDILGEVLIARELYQLQLKALDILTFLDGSLAHLLAIAVEPDAIEGAHVEFQQRSASVTLEREAHLGTSSIGIVKVLDAHDGSHRHAHIGKRGERGIIGQVLIHEVLQVLDSTYHLDSVKQRVDTASGANQRTAVAQIIGFTTVSLLIHGLVCRLSNRGCKKHVEKEKKCNFGDFFKHTCT